MAGFLQMTDAALLSWSGVFSAKIAIDAAAYSLTPAQAAQFESLRVAFAGALAAALNPSTRTRGIVARKNDAKRELTAYARVLTGVVRAAPQVNNAQRIALGMPVRERAAARIPVPDEPPSLRVTSALGRTIRLELRALHGDGRGKPDGVAGATIFSFIGDAPPPGYQGWTQVLSTTRTSCNVSFPPSVPAGAQVFFTAFWFNPRGQRGPACTPISLHVPGGVSLSLAA